VTEAFLVIHSGPDGLYPAPAYYAAFPQEPSPFGMLTFTQAKTAVMGAGAASLFVAVQELAKAGNKGAAMLVCHAYTDGLLLPVAPGGNSVFAESGTMDTIDQLSGLEATHDQIRAMPQSDDTERQAVLAKWETFYTSLPWPPGATPPSLRAGFTDADAERVYQQWFSKWAAALEFHRVADLRELFKRVKALRVTHLDRIELRACNIGGAPKAMERVRTFFGCDRLSAPTEGTFFGVVPVRPLMVLRRPRGSHGPSATPGPLGHDESKDAAASTGLMTQSDTTRGFLFFSSTINIPEPGQPHLPRFAIPFFEEGTLVELYHGFRFVLRIKEIRAFFYQLDAWAAGSSKSAAPDPDFIRQFCAGVFKADTTFRATSLPTAGLWTPGRAKPFVLPLESEYLPLIAQSPTPTPKKP
jgi:hypothetical protein